MSYRAWFEGGALIQLKGLPAAAFDVRAGRLSLLAGHEVAGSTLAERPSTTDSVGPTMLP